MTKIGNLRGGSLRYSIHLMFGITVLEFTDISWKYDPYLILNLYLDVFSYMRMEFSFTVILDDASFFVFNQSLSLLLLMFPGLSSWVPSLSPCPTIRAKTFYLGDKSSYALPCCLLLWLESEGDIILILILMNFLWKSQFYMRMYKKFMKNVCYKNLYIDIRVFFTKTFNSVFSWSSWRPWYNG